MVIIVLFDKNFTQKKTQTKSYKKFVIYKKHTPKSDIEENLISKIIYFIKGRTQFATRHKVTNFPQKKITCKKPSKIWKCKKHTQKSDIRVN